VTTSTSRRGHRCPPVIRRIDSSICATKAAHKIGELLEIERERLRILEAAKVALHKVEVDDNAIDDAVVRSTLMAAFTFTDEHYTPEFCHNEDSEGLGRSLASDLGILTGQMIDTGSGAGPMYAYRIAEEIAECRETGTCPECETVHKTGRLQSVEAD